MAQSYRKSVTAVMASEGDMSSGYGTRNKRRKLNEIEVHSSVPRRFPATETINVSSPLQSPNSATFNGRHKPIYSSNLDRALKSILSENPRSQRTRMETETMREMIEVTPSVDEDATSTVVPDRTRHGRTSSLSMSSPSRETTPSSSLATLTTIDIPPFITLFKQEREKGRVPVEIKQEALKMLRDWREEWCAEDKRVRTLKRRIKSHTAVAQTDVAPASSVEERGRVSSVVGRREGNRTGAETSKKVVLQEVSKSPESSSGSGRRRDSVTGTGPNGLSGSYWDIQVDQMGRGSRRRTKDGGEVTASGKQSEVR